MGLPRPALMHKFNGTKPHYPHRRSYVHLTFQYSDLTVQFSLPFTSYGSRTPSFSATGNWAFYRARTRPLHSNPFRERNPRFLGDRSSDHGRGYQLPPCISCWRLDVQLLSPPRFRDPTPQRASEEVGCRRGIVRGDRDGSRWGW